MGKLRHLIRSCFWKAFGRAEGGSTTTMFAVMMPALLGLAGGAVDYAAVTAEQGRLQAATDSIALAIAREMTLSPLTADRIQSLAVSYAGAHVGNTVTVSANLAENGMAVQVRLKKTAEMPLGILQMAGGPIEIGTSALARVTASNQATKLCVLSLGEKTNGGIFMHNNAVITAPQCMLQSNSAVREAVIIQQGSKLQASTVCARGGIANAAGTLQSTLVTDCPSVTNPLAQKPEPPVNGPCTATALIIRGAEKRTLSPGVYCSGLTIEDKAKVTLSPGVYVFRDGPLLVSQNAEFVGAGVTLMFSGKRAYFRFLDNSLIQISAPASGLTAGMLIWESRNFVLGDNSWQKGGCGGNRDDDDDDVGPTNCGQPLPGQVKPKKTNEHHINSDRARELTGTIYLRNGLLLIDSRRSVAEQSPFTVLVVNKLDLYDGPNLTLNANFSSTPIPVPAGLGALGAQKVRLGM